MNEIYCFINVNHFEEIIKICVIDFNKAIRYFGGSRIADKKESFVFLYKETIGYFVYHFKIITEKDVERFLNVNFEYYRGKPVNHFFKTYSLDELLI